MYKKIKAQFLYFYKKLNLNKMKSNKIIIAIASLVLFLSCATNPFTGKQTMALPGTENSSLFPASFQQYDQFLSENKVIVGSYFLNKFLNSAVVCDDGHMGTSPQSFGYAQPSHYATVRTTTANNGWNNYVLIVGADGDYSFNNFRFYVNGIEQITNCDHNWGNSQWQFNFPDYRLMIGNKPNSIEG